MAVDDFNGDGKADIAATNELDDTIAVFTNQTLPGPAAVTPSRRLVKGPTLGLGTRLQAWPSQCKISVWSAVPS